MSFNSGTIAGSVNPALDLMTALHAELIAHPGWTYIEQVVSGTTTRVYRCNGATNSHGADFYLYISRTADNAAVVRFALSELWTTGGLGTITYPVPSGTISTATTTPDASGRSTATATAINFNNASLSTVNVNATSFYWMCSITNDRIVVGTLTGGTSAGVYAGGYERLYSSAVDPVPLALFAPSVNANGLGGSANLGFVRELAPFVAATNLWRLYSIYATSPLGIHSQQSSVDITTGRYVASRILIGGATSAARASARGQLRDVLGCIPNISTATGDTATINGVAYTCSNNGIWVRNGA